MNSGTPIAQVDHKNKLGNVSFVLNLSQSQQNTETSSGKVLLDDSFEQCLMSIFHQTLSNCLQPKAPDFQKVSKYLLVVHINFEKEKVNIHKLNPQETMLIVRIDSKLINTMENPQKEIMKNARVYHMRYRHRGYVSAKGRLTQEEKAVHVIAEQYNRYIIGELQKNI